MKRKAAWSGFSFLAGTILYCLWSGSERALWLLTALAVIAGIQIFRRYWVFTCVVGLMFTAGLLNAMVFTHFRVYPQYRLEGKEYCISGTVKQCTYLGGDRWRILIAGRTKEGVRCRLLFNSDRPIDEWNTAEVTAFPELLKDTVRFPSASYYNSKGIYLQSSNVTGVKDNGPGRNYVMRLATRLRDRMSKSISTACDEETAAFLQALICGDKSDVPNVSKEVLYRTGLGHLFAVSGMHLTVIALLFCTIFSTLKLPKHLSSLLMCFIIIIFMAFAGFSPSVTRAGIMHILVFTASLLGRRTDCLNSLGLCALIMAAQNPYSVLTVSFLLSFTSAAAIGAAAPILTRRLKESCLRSAKVSVLNTLTVMAATMPLQILFFNEISVAAPLTNLLLAPFCTAALALLPVSMLLGGSTAPAVFFTRISGALVRFTLFCCKKLAGLRFVTISGYHRIILYLMAVALVWALVFALVNGSTRVLAFGSAAILVFAWSFSTIASYFGRGRVRVMLIHSGYTTTAVIIRHDSAAVLDLGSNGNLCYTVQQLFSYYGVNEFTSSYIHGNSATNRYQQDLIPPAEINIASYEWQGSFDPLIDTEVRCTDRSCELTVCGTELTLTSNSAVINGNTIDLAGQKAIVEIDIDSDSCTVCTFDNDLHRSREIVISEN